MKEAILLKFALHSFNISVSGFLLLYSEVFTTFAQVYKGLEKKKGNCLFNAKQSFMRMPRESEIEQIVKELILLYIIKYKITHKGDMDDKSYRLSKKTLNS